MAERTAVKKVENAVLYSDGTIRIDKVRLSYPHIFEPWCKDKVKEKPRYSAVGIVPKSSHKAVQKLIVEVMNQVLTDKNKGQKIKAELKFFRDGEPKNEDGTPEPIKPEYVGAWTINASERPENPPSVRNRQGKPVRDVAEKKLFYPGAYVNMLIRPWWQDNDSGQRINANLVALQFVKDGERIGEAGISEDEIDDSFENLGDDEGGSESAEDDDEL